MNESSSSIATTVPSIASESGSHGAKVSEVFGGFKEQYDSLDLFREALQRYSFEAKKNIRVDSVKKNARVRHWVCAHCNSWRVILTTPRTLSSKGTTGSASAKDSEDNSESQALENTKETLEEKKAWRISTKSNFIHGTKVVSNDGIESLEPCIGGSYKASAVSIQIP